MRNSAKKTVPYNEIDRNVYGRATQNEYFRQKLVETAIIQDEEGSYFNGMLNILADHTIGPYPHLLGDHPNETACDEIEDRWKSWCENNEIGKALREIRRGAAKTGLGIGIPYVKLDSLDEVKLGIKVICASNLKNPHLKGYKDRIIDGIEYDKNWDPLRLHFSDGSYYDVKDVFIWSKKPMGAEFRLIPECGPALCLFPSVRRVMDAVVRRMEFKSSTPMAVKLDPLIYRPEDASQVPRGAYKYEPGSVPTLPPGTDLVGVPITGDSKDDAQFIKLVVGAGARCFTMPANLVFGSSADSNMASSQVDMVPWENKIEIDRVDFLPVIKKIFTKWITMAELVEGYLSPRTKQYIKNFRYTVNYGNVFRHPDPQKNANARLIDMISGNNTLYRTCTNAGLNPRRERKREAALLGITPEQLSQHYLAARTNLSQVILKAMEEEDPTTDKKEIEDESKESEE